MKYQRRTKYGNIKVRIHGNAFDSKKEAKRYRELLLLEEAGDIYAIQLHPRFLIIDGFTTRWGEKIRPAYYTADFQYIDTNRGHGAVVEDVKSPPTRKKPDYILRKKLFMTRYPSIHFKEV